MYYNRFFFVYFYNTFKDIERAINKLKDRYNRLENNIYYSINNRYLFIKYYQIQEL